jgi:hypothetical protein
MHAAKSGNILSKIRLVRLRVRLIGMIKVLALALLMLAAGALISFLVDHEWEPDVPVRVPLMLFIGGIVAVGILSSAWLWLRQDLSDDKVALMIEDANPHLEDGFISAVQLSRELQQGDQYLSNSMIEAMVSRTASSAGGLSPVKQGRVLPLFPILLVSLAFSAGLISTFSMEGTKKYAETWADRVLRMKKSVNYPKPVYIEVQIPKENLSDGGRRIVHVVRGEDLTINVDITSGGTEKMVVNTDFLISGQREKKTMARVSDKTFTKTFQNVTEPFSFFIDAGYDVFSEIYKVELVDRARIEEAQFWLKYPEYTHLDPTPEQNPITRTYLELPAGTTVRYKVYSTLPVKTAKLQLYQDTANKKAEQGPEPTVSTEGPLAGREINGQFQIMASMRFRFTLISSAGVVSDKSSVMYSVKAIEDRPPTVTFKTPGRSKSVTKKAVVPMLLSVKDQYGVDRVELRTSISRNGVAIKKDKKVLDNPKGSEKKAIYEWDFRIEDLELREGDQIEYYAVAFDRNIDESKRVGQSLAYTFTIVSNDDLSRLLQDRMMRIKEDLESVSKTQMNARKDMADTVDKLSLKKTLDRDDQRRLTRMENAQRNVSNRMKQIAESFDQLLKERQVNQMRDEREDVLQKSLKKATKDIAEVQSPAVTRDIRDVTSKPEKIDQTKLSRIPDKQENVENSIRKLVDKLDKWGDISDADRELKEIIDIEERIRKATGDKLKQQNK